VRIQVSRVDLDGRKIDFRLIQDGEALLSRAMADKGIGRETKTRGDKGRPDRSDVLRSGSAFVDEPRKRSTGKQSKSSKPMEKGSTASKKAPRKRR
jgi:ribonuclease R